MPPDETIQGFISYAHADATSVDRLIVQLRPIGRYLPVKFWRDLRGLRTGHLLDGGITAAISASHIFVLAVTPDFLNSDYIFDKELPAILKRVDAISGLILVVILKKCRWEPFVGPADLVAAPLTSAGQLLPVSDWPNEDGFDAAGKQLYEAIKGRYSLGAVDVLARRPQEKGGLAFEPETRLDGSGPRYFTLATKVASDDAEAARRPETRQRQAEARAKAELLAGQTARLGNNPTWAGLAMTTRRTAELLKLDAAALAAQACPLWSLSQSLATYAAQDDRLSQTPTFERNGDPLAAEQRRALDDLLTALPVLVRRFPSVVRDDALLGSEANRPVDRKQMDEFLKRLNEVELLNPVTEETVKALQESPKNGSKSNAERRMDQLIVGTARNIGSAALGSAAGWVTRQTAQGTTGDIAQGNTELDRKTKEFVANEREALVALYRDIPDMVRAIDVLAERIADRRYTPFVPADIDVVPHEPPPAFSVDKVRAMILRGEEPPRDWKDLIDNLNFEHSTLADLAPIAGLSSLQVLGLNHTKVADLAPIASLTQLQYLSLDATQIVDLACIANLTQLRYISLRSTHIVDLAPLAHLPDLRLIQVNDHDLAAKLMRTLARGWSIDPEGDLRR